MNSGLFSLLSKCHSVTHGAGGPSGSGVDRGWTGGGPSLPHLSAGCQEAAPPSHPCAAHPMCAQTKPFALRGAAYNAGQQGGRGPERPEDLCPKEISDPRKLGDLQDKKDSQRMLLCFIDPAKRHGGVRFWRWRVLFPHIDTQPPQLHPLRWH